MCFYLNQFKIINKLKLLGVWGQSILQILTILYTLGWYFCPLMLVNFVHLCAWIERNLIMGHGVKNLERKQPEDSRWKGLHPFTVSVVFHGTSWHFHAVTCFLSLAGSLLWMPWETELFLLWKAGAELVFFGWLGHLQDFLLLSLLPASLLLSFPSVKTFRCYISNILTIHEAFSSSFF